MESYKCENNTEFIIIDNGFSKSGGNGKVVDIKIINTDDDKQYVAKFFNANNYIEERYERFKKEVSTVYYELNNISGIIHIKDFCLPNKHNNENDAHYIMLKAKAFNKRTKMSIPDILEKFLSLAYTIEKLHDLKYYHRDIKPENILLLNDEIVLSDFGLVFREGDDHLTRAHERIGPYNISPPEFIYKIDESVIDYQFSDVYLFAKTLWMYLKCNDTGFPGQYSIFDDKIALKDDSARSLKPLNDLLTKATKDINLERISIKECISLINDQLDIYYGSYDEEKIRVNNLYEKYLIELNKFEKDKIIYNRIDKIRQIFHSIIKYTKINIFNTYKKENIREIKIRDDRYTEKMFIITEKNGDKEYTYVFNFESLTCSNEELVFKLKPFDSHFQDYINVDSFSVDTFNYYMSDNIQLIINIDKEMKIINETIKL